MKFLSKTLFILLITFSVVCLAGRCGGGNQEKDCQPVCDTCCGSMGGVSYCDSSAGRLVCNNGFYSSCYCDRHAVMDLTHLEGCCLWQGGVLDTDDGGNVVICNNGAVSVVCSQELRQQEHRSSW